MPILDGHPYGLGWFTNRQGGWWADYSLESSRLRRFARRRRAFCLRVTGFTNPPIGQALAFDPAQGFVGAKFVIDPEADAV